MASGPPTRRASPTASTGENSAVFVADGDYPYGFAAVSSGDPPHFMNSLPTDGTAYDIEPIGTLAYVADGDAGLKVVDITRYWEDPTVIEEIETFDSARELWLEGEYLLVADDGGGILIYRVLDIEPAFEAAIPVIHGSWGTQYEDGLVYSTPVGYMLSIFDYSILQPPCNSRSGSTRPSSTSPTSA